jgi:hypothetical protein
MGTIIKENSVGFASLVDTLIDGVIKPLKALKQENGSDCGWLRVIR